MLGLHLFPVGYFALVHSKRKPAVGIGADPSFEEHRGALLAIIRERNESTIIAFLAFRQVHLHPPNPAASLFRPLAEIKV